MDIASLLWGYSKALYSTWLFYRPDHLLLDCGEGAASALGNGGYGIERVLLTHGHIDHIGGLPTLLWTRAGGMGDTDKPLAIFYPAGDPLVGLMRGYLHASRKRWPFELQWVEIEPDDSISLTSGQGQHARRVTCFATRHIRNQLTLGYKVLETRRRLKPQYASLPPQEIGKLAREVGSESLSESYEAPLIVWSGDTAPLSLEDAVGAEVLVHEATILNAEDKKGQEHSSLDEALDVAREARPKALALYHFSGRYRASEIRERVARGAEARGLECEVWCLVRDKISRAWPPGSPLDTKAARKTSNPAPQVLAGPPQVLEAPEVLEGAPPSPEENS